MGTRGLKICKACRRSFEPQLTDSEIREIWFTEQELEMDEEHRLYSGHGHLQAPYQDLCERCSMDPNVEAFPGGLFGGPPVYRVRDPERDRPRRLPVQDGNVIAPPKQSLHKVQTSDGFGFTIDGPLPPQEVIDTLGAAIRKGLPGGEIGPAVRVKITKKKKRRTLWQRLFGKKKKP